jgi:2-(1,2-epoxy-1,2-dihydrophenyl)acetyl-CoA isomerase
MADLIEKVEDGVALLTLNRPERLNAFSPEMLAGLREVLPRLASDDAVGAIVITGSGRGFTAGGDVKTMAARAAGQTFEQRLESYRAMHQLPSLMRSLPRVIIGMINGPAVGAGLGLALACDLRIAGRSARFATGFANVGYSGDFGGSWLLTRLVGTARARELYFLNEMVDANRAAEWGIVNRVVDDAELATETMSMARRIAQGPRVALGYMKRNLHAAETEPFSAVLELEALHQARAGQTEDHREAVAAFNEKRAPRFKGR